jgi:alanine racemase
MRPTFAFIDLAALKENYLNIRRKTAPSKVMAVVKADAYGHGVEKVVTALNSLGSDKPEYFAVAIPEEGIEVRKYDSTTPILLFDAPYSAEDVKIYHEYNLIPTIFTSQHIEYIEKGVSQISEGNSGVKLKVHIKIDTGMNRVGVHYSSGARFLEMIAQNSNIETDGIYTHFATSDERSKTFAKVQFKRFSKLLSQLRANKINYGLAHAANSGAILDLENTYLDIVRPGISLYGYYPSLDTSGSIPLTPVMSLISQVSHVKEIEAGETVSYGRKFKASKVTNIATIPCGYADGYNRNLTNKGKAIINGKIYSQVGRVTMDRIMIKLDSDSVAVGSEAILLGNSDGHCIDAWDWSRSLKTIPYEITCGISKRVPRIYKD